MARKIITFEGFVDYDPGYEFDLDVFMLRPVRQHDYSGNDGGIDYLVEDYCINLSLGDRPEDLDQSEFMNEEWNLEELEQEFQRLKVAPTETRCYWRRVVEYDPDTEETFRVIEAEGGLDEVMLAAEEE